VRGRKAQRRRRQEPETANGQSAAHRKILARRNTTSLFCSKLHSLSISIHGNSVGVKMCGHLDVSTKALPFFAGVTNTYL
jgi:hypothetical protein